MSRIRPKHVAWGMFGGGLLAVGVATGMWLEDRLIGRRSSNDPYSQEPFGQLRGRRMTVTADDGTTLIAEVDDADVGEDDLTIVFTHGFSLNMDCWHYQRQALRGKVRMVFWDLRSHGRSGQGEPAARTVDQLGKDLTRIIEDCAPEGPVIVVGHSMGGMAIMALAQEHPEWFGERILGAALLATSSGRIYEAGLGLPAPAAGFVHSKASEIATIAKANREVIDLGRHQINDLTYLLTHTYSFGSGRADARTKFVAEMLAATPIDVIADFAPHIEAHDKHDALNVLSQVDTLVMVGDRDLITPHHHSVEIARYIPGAELIIIPATGHMIIMERYHEVNRHLLELLRQVRKNLPK